MKRFILPALAACIVTGAWAAKPKLEYTNGHELTLINKLMDTPRRYARVDTVAYDGFTDFQRRNLVQHSAGLALAFETNSDKIFATVDYIKRGAGLNAPLISLAGVDLYIKNDKGEWVWAGNGVSKTEKPDAVSLVENMKPGNKECLLYLPIYSIVDSVKIGVEPGAYVRPIENPFSHRVVFHGSSFTHGSSTSRPGMSYVMQFERATGLHTPVLGVSGNSKLEQSWARVLADTPADAFVLDAFSNPSAKEIEERFDAFVKTIREKQPTTPIIFMQTIYREHRNFDTLYDKREQDKMDAAERMVKRAMETDPNIYLIETSTGDTRETTCDGTHPSDFGYYYWMQSIKQPVLDILARYNIKP